MKNEDDLGKVPRVFLNMEIQPEECHLVVYKALSATVCLFIEGETSIPFSGRSLWRAAHLSRTAVVDTVVADSTRPS